MQFFKKKDTDESVVAKKNWYADRYQTVLVQRNFLVLLTLISLVGIISSVLAVIKVTSSKTVEPFVIEIEERTGITNVIRPIITEQYTRDEALRRYFVVKYVNARESYDSESYKYNYEKIVKTLSSNDVYSQFRSSISADNPQSPLRLGKTGQRTIKIVSLSPIPTEKNATTKKAIIGGTVQVRFIAMEQTTNMAAVPKNLIATISYQYLDLKLTTEDRDINPLGFQITGYRVDAEAL
ncbi:MAG: hypothetical protein K0R98_1357 [Rickettsiaceae bacterium]|jgi:type IV secretion system protein VirB8|nr:hypothetical protein [Rickettsiaceae bacterium]